MTTEANPFLCDEYLEIKQKYGYFGKYLEEDVVELADVK
jgi:hypothetical protein